MELGTLSREIFEDQLQEIDRDVQRGIIFDAEADAARVELTRNILRVSRVNAPQAERRDNVSLLGVLLAALLIPVISFSYYLQFGNPEVPSLSLADRQAERDERNAIITIANRMEGELKSHPEGGPSNGWMLLGQTFMRLGFYDRAAEAFDVVASRKDADSAVFSMLAEALISQEQGIVTPRAEDAIAQALERDPMNPAATFYTALSLEQSGQARKAHDIILERLGKADGFYPWMESFVAQANRIGAIIGRAPVSLTQFAPMTAQSGPTDSDIAAAQDMSEEERAAFIASMVNRLATRLEANPDDLDGWLRLGKAYSVMGNREGALEAFENAARLSKALPDDDLRKDVASNMLRSLRD